MRTALFICAVTGVALSARGALAATHPSARVELSRTPDAGSCMDARRLTKSVEARLRRRVFTEGDDADLSVQVALSRRDEQWLADITLADAVGELGRREITTSARHCSALDDSLALVVALLVDTPPERPPATPTPPTPATPIAATATPTDALARPDDARPKQRATPLDVPADTVAPRQPWDFSLRASAAGALGLLPGAALGFGTTVSARPPRGPWLRLSGELFLPNTEQAGEAGVELSARRIGLDVCGALLVVGSSRVELCAGQRLAQLSVRGLGFDRNRETARTYFGFTVGLEGVIPIGRYVAIVAGLRLEAPLTRDRFAGRSSLGDDVELYRVSPLVGLANLGVEVAL